MTLNGWQRLWVLVSVTWLVPVLLLSYQRWPPADKYADPDPILAVLAEVQHSLALDRGAVIGNAAALWLLPSVALYALGVGVTWVGGGFRERVRVDEQATPGSAQPVPALQGDGSPLIKRRDWWIGVSVITLALLLHAAFPRYEWRQQGIALWRIDRWTGTAAEVGRRR